MRFTRLRFHLTLILLFFFATVQGFNKTQEATYRVLFIGNSYTYYNSMPQMLKALIAHNLPESKVNVKFIGGGGATIKKHWDVGLALKEIRTGKWNYVVLQGQSMLGTKDLTNPKSLEQFYKYVRKFDHEIKKNNGETVLFMTWARKNQQDNQKYITAAYSSMAKELGCKLAPVGLVWAELREDKSIELYKGDKSHPSVLGSYLTALSISSIILDGIPKKLPGDLSGYEILRGGKLSAKKSKLCSISPDIIQIFHKVVSKTIITDK